MDWKERLKGLMLETGVGSSRTRRGVRGIGSTRTTTTTTRRRPDPVVAQVDTSPEARRKYYRRENDNTNRQKSTNQFTRSSDFEPGVIGVTRKT